MSCKLRTTNWHNLGRIGFGQSGFRTNRLACDVKRVIAVQHMFLYALGPTLIFICPVLRTFTIGIIYRETYKGITKFNIIYVTAAKREELSGSRQKRRVIWRPLEGLSGGRQKRRVTGDRKIDRFIRKKTMSNNLQIWVKYTKCQT